MEKVEGSGEDAEPTLVMEPPRGWVGVYDGMGGSGAERASPEEGGETGARVAAVAARAAVEYAVRAADDPIDEAFARELGHTLFVALKDLDESRPGAGKIKGRLIRRFPLAFASAAFSAANDAAFYRVFWAGDARAYAWTPKFGLQQLTADDLVRPADAFDQLYGDSPLANCLSAGGFALRTAAAAVPAPAVFLAATDGCFHYLPSPFHFEYLLAETLLAADAADEWKTFVIKKIEKTTGDDASMALCAVGFEDFASMRAAFADRCALLWNDWVKPYADAVKRAGPKNEVGIYEAGPMQSGAELWKRYKPGYSALVPVAESPPVLRSFDFR